jgi:hypothetical protein
MEQVPRGSRCDGGEGGLVLLAMMAVGALQRGVGGGSALQKGAWGGGSAHGGEHACGGYG